MTDSLDAYRYYSLAMGNAGGYHSNEALALLEKAVALDPQFAMAYARIGYIYAFVRVNEGERAKPYLDRAFRLSSRLTEKEKLYVKAWHAHASGDLGGAVSALYELIKQYPQEIEAYSRLGFILRHGTDRKDEALHIFERAAAIDPDAQDIQNQLGFLYQHFGRYDEAIVAHQRYVQLAPKEPNAYDSLGMSYAQAGRYEEAIRTLNHALALNPEFHFATRHLGDVYFCLGRYQEALGQYQKYLKTAPSDWDRATACDLIVRVHLAKNDWSQAEKVARQEWRYHNDFGGLLLTALARNDLQAAEKLRARISEQSPDPSLPFAAEPRVRHYLLGLYAMKAGHTDEALRLFDDSQRRAPFYWNIDTSVGCLARAYLDLGRFDQAVSEYERLSRVNPNWALTHYWLGVAYEGAGEQCKAHAAYERFLQIWKGADSDLPEVIKAKERVINLHCPE
jgi:tetratricopeptide (TPR) repeat protein